MLKTAQSSYQREVKNGWLRAEKRSNVAVKWAQNDASINSAEFEQLRHQNDIKSGAEIWKYRKKVVTLQHKRELRIKAMKRHRQRDHPSQCLGRVVRMPPTTHSDALHQPKKCLLRGERKHRDGSCKASERLMQSIGTAHARHRKGKVKGYG